MHVPDGILPAGTLIATSIVAVGSVAVGLRKLDYDTIPRAGVVAAVFFVVSLVHVRTPYGAVHMALSGLAGMTLGWAAFPAMAVALFLQAILFGHGGVTTLGANVVIMGMPAVCCYYLFAPRMSGRTIQRRAFARGVGAGVLGVLLAWLVFFLVMLSAGNQYKWPAVGFLLMNVVVMPVEALVTGWAVAFLARVRPSILTAPSGRKLHRENSHVAN